MEDPANPLIERSDAEFRAAYEILRTIGAGGGGEVYLATQRSLSRPVVVKVIQPQLLADDVQRRRFEREALMLSRLSHARITQLYEYGMWGERPFLVMEYVDGGSLASLMEASGPMVPREALRIALEIAEGLSYLHGCKMLHRDIKPGNILLSQQREVKIADFGLARPHDEAGLTGEGLVVGTLWYIAPELLVAEEASVRTDIYSLGMVTYQMLTMRMAFREDITDIVKLAQHRVNEPAIPIQQHAPDLPFQICSLVNRMIATDPEARPGSADEVVEELVQLHDALATPSRRIKRAPRPGEAPSLPADGTLDLSAEDAEKADPDRLRQTRRGEYGARTGGGLRGADGEERAASDGAKKSRRTRRTAGAWHALSAHARALMFGFALAGACAGLMIGLRSRPAPPPIVDSDPKVGRVTELVIERFPKWAHARMTSVTPGKLVVRVTPAGGVQGKAVEAVSSDLHEHDVSVEPLDPRLGYHVQARLRLPNGQEQSVGSRTVPSPVMEMLTLARELEKMNVLEALKAYDISRGRKKPPQPERLAGLLERHRWKSRLAVLGDTPAAVYADPDTKESDLIELYRGLAPVRLLDHYAEAHGVPFASNVEKVMPFDLTGNKEPLPRLAPVSEAQLDTKRLLVPYDPSSELLIDMGDQLSAKSPLYSRSTEQLEGTLEVPEGLEKKPRAQVRLSVTNVRSAMFTMTIEGVPVPLQFVPPYAAAITGESISLYHTLPPRWLTAGTRRVTVRARVTPCTENNTHQPLRINIELERNIPRVDEVSLLAP